MKNVNSTMQEDYEEFISLDPEDKEFKETIKNVRKKLETPVSPAMPCKTSKKNKHGKTCGKTNDFVEIHSYSDPSRALHKST